MLVGEGEVLSTLQDMPALSFRNMPTHLFSVGALAALTFTFVKFLCYFFPGPIIRLKQAPTSTYQQILSEVGEILNPNTLTVEEQIAARARSNQRLVRALNLSNTFVSPDPATHKFFVGHAQHLLRSAQRRGGPISEKQQSKQRNGNFHRSAPSPTNFPQSSNPIANSRSWRLDSNR